MGRRCGFRIVGSGEVTMKMFGFSGRIGRLEFFGLTVLLALLTVAAGFLAVFVLPSRRWLVVVYGVYAVAYWAATALAVRRLHDIGWHGAHALWIMPIAAVAMALRHDGTEIAILFAFVALGLGLWLLFAPGQD